MSSAPRKVGVTLGALVLLFVLSQCVGVWIPGLDVLLYLAVGWVPFLNRVAPQIKVRWDLVLSTLAYATVLVVGSHLFLRWLLREMWKPGSGGDSLPATDHRRWRWRWTLGGFAILFLMFAAGIASVGIAHQSTWLARSPEPFYRRNNSRLDRIKCASNLRQIGQGLQLYASAHDAKLPDNLSALLLEADETGLIPDVFVCPAGVDEPPDGTTPEELAAELLKPGHCSYIYFGSGLELNPDSDAKRAIAVELLDNHRHEGINALFADGHTEWLDTTTAEALLLKLGFQRVEIGVTR